MNGEYGHSGNPKEDEIFVYFDLNSAAGNGASFIDETDSTGKFLCTINCHSPSSEADWYQNDIPNWVCSDCHGAAITGRRQITGISGDFGANNAPLKSHHVSGGADPTEDQCKVCHDQSLHTAGSVILRHADGSASTTYNSSNPSTLEPFCLSCHDLDGASATFISGGSALNPFNNGSILGSPPYPYSTHIAESWAKNYGHGSSSRTPATRLTCMGTGSPGTGCHGNNGSINAHGSANEVLAVKQFDFFAISGIYDEAVFTLCFDCHANYPGYTKEDTLGVKEFGALDKRYGYMNSRPGNPVGQRKNPPYYASGVTTNFADHNAVATQVGNGPMGTIFAGGYIWVVNSYDENVLKIDISTNKVVVTIGVGQQPGPSNGIAFDGTHVWVSNNGDWNLSKIDVSDNSVVNVSAGDMYPHGVNFGGGYIWVSTKDYVKKINVSTNAIVASIDFTGKRPEGIAYDGTYLWVANKTNEVPKVDITSNSIVATVPVGNSPYGVIFAGGYNWVTNMNSDNVSKIDTTTGSVVATITVGDNPRAMAYDGTYLWVTNNISQNVSKIDIITETVIATIGVSGKAIGIAYDGSYVWVTNLNSQSLSKIDVSTDKLDRDPYGISDMPTHLSGTKNDMNLHWYHLRFYTNFRGTGLPGPPWERSEMCDNCHRSVNDDANMSCVNCHNVHGSNSPYGAVYDEMGYTSVSGPWGMYGKLPDEVFLPDTDPNFLDLDIYPTYCAYNCHNASGDGAYLDVKGPNKSWFDLIKE